MSFLVEKKKYKRLGVLKVLSLLARISSVVQFIFSALISLQAQQQEHFL